MKLTVLSGILGVIAVTTATSSSLADEAGWTDNEGWYIGANVGRSESNIDNLRIVNGLMEAGSSVTSMRDDGSDMGYKLFGGYQFNKYIAVEGGYFDLGEFTFAATVPPRTINGNIEVRGVNLDLVGFLPFTEKFSAFARAGVHHSETEDSFSSTGLVPLSTSNASAHDTSSKFGAGVQYDFTDAVAMRVEAERYRVNDGVGNNDNVDLVSLGLVYRFGAKKAPIAPQPAPVAEPVRPPAPRFEKFTLSATELFAFDSAELRMPQPKLDEIANILASDQKIDKVVVTGYTDRIGTEDYNQTLSEQRALAVKNYLVSKGIDTNRLDAVGKGEADPIVECSNKNRADLIKCLQPNRRVEVDQITIVRQVPSK